MTRGRLAVVTATVFGFAGPLLGFLGVAMIPLAMDLGRHANSFQLDLVNGLSLMPVAYLLGAIPAVVAGGVVGAIAIPCGFTSGHSIARRLVVGIVVGSACGGAWQSIAFSNSLSDPLLLARCGAIAGAVLTLFVPRPQWLLQAVEPAATNAH